MEDCSIDQLVQLCEYENQTLEAFVAASRSYAKFDCPVARQNFSLLPTAHDCETGLFIIHVCISHNIVFGLLLSIQLIYYINIDMSFILMLAEM